MEPDIANTQSRKHQSACLCCLKVEAVEYFKLLGIRNGDTNAVTEKSLNLAVKSFPFSRVVSCSPAPLLNFKTCTKSRPG